MTIAAKPLPDALNFIDSTASELAASNDNVVITGATGWLGQALVEMLMNSIGAERIHAFSSRENTLYLRDGRGLRCKPLSELAALPFNRKYGLFHFAFLTKDKQADMKPEEYIAANVAIRNIVEQFIGEHAISGLCVASSGAVYTKDRQLQRDRSANAYGALKVEDEEFFGALAARRKIPIVIPRIFNMSGPYINKWPAYALSSLIFAALEKEKLVIKAQHPVIRAYAYVGDILNVTLAHCLNNRTSIFDACMPNEIEIGELAARICNVMQYKGEILRDYRPGLPEDRYTGDSTLFLQTCQKERIAPLGIDAQIRITAEDLKRRHLQNF